jgi:peptide/nickel transport system permease protein
MVNFLIRRVIAISIITIIVAFVAYLLFYIAPGGPLAKLAELGAGIRIDAGAEERVKKQYDLDLYHVPRFARWLIGEPRDAITIGGQTINFQVGCLKEGKARLVYPDGRVEESNCQRPIYMSDLKDEQRRVGNGVLRLDFGLSQQILRDRPVTTLILSRLGPTVLLIGISTLLSLIIAIPLGVLAAVKQYSRFDYFVTTITFFGASMPSLFLGLMLILFFGIVMKDAGMPYLPTALMVSNSDAVIPILGLRIPIQAESLADRIWHLILPVAVLTFISLAGWSRFIRGSMLEVLRQDYVRTARAKGLNERVVIVKHALRNSLIPFVTIVVGIIPAVISGAVITETIFSWPGLGRLYIDSLNRSDYTVSMGILLMLTVLTLVSFLIADLLYTVVDPRIRLS